MSSALAFILEVYPLKCPEWLTTCNETICSMFKSYREEGHHVSTFLASSWGFFWLYCTDLICLWTSLCDGGGGEQIPVMKSVKINFQTWGWSQCHRITWGKMTRRRGFSREIQSTVTRRQREMNAGRSAAGVFNQLFSVFLAGLNVIINAKHVTPCLAQRRCPVSMSLVFQLLFHNCVCVCVCVCVFLPREFHGQRSVVGYSP